MRKKLYCPECNAEMVLRDSKYGLFYGCSRYPDCDFTSWKRPIATPCPNCGGILVMTNKRHVTCLDCEETFLQDDILDEAEMA